MPVGAQCVSRMPISWPWNTGRPWWPDCVIERDRRAFEVVAEVLERVEVRVRAEQADVADLHEAGEAVLELLALGAGLGEAGREDHRELRPCARSTSSKVSTGAAGEDDREVEVAGDVEDRLVTRVAEHRLVARGAPG